MIGSWACAVSVVTAIAAAAAASSPWPNPSMTPTSTPAGKGATTYRSPETDCPARGRAATAQAMRGREEEWKSGGVEESGVVIVACFFFAYLKRRGTTPFVWFGHHSYETAGSDRSEHTFLPSAMSLTTRRSASPSQRQSGRRATRENVQ